MSLINIKQIILFIFIIGLSESQNIITSWHYDKVQMYDIQKIGTILQTQLKEKVTDLPEFTEDNIKISNLLFTDVQISLYDSYLNFNTGLFLFTPNKVTLSFNFSYSASGSSGDAQLDIKVNTLKMRVKNNKEDQTQTSSVTMSSSLSDYNIYGVTNKEIVNQIKSALYKGFENNKILNDKIASKLDVINYYKDFYNKKKSFVFQTSKFLNSKDFTVNVNRFVGFCEDVTGKVETGLCYYSGELNGEEDKKDKSKVPIYNEKFTSSKETYNMFVNKDLVNKIVSKVVSEGLPDKTYKEGSTSKKLSYDFTVASLKKYFSGLDSYKSDEKFETTIHIEEITLNNAKFNVFFNIGDKTNVFSVSVEMNTQINVSILKTVRFNLCLGSTSTTSVKISSGSNINISDEKGLKEVIDESFDPSGVPLCFSDSGVSLRDYYSVITNAYSQEEGFYFEGNQLYQ